MIVQYVVPNESSNFEARFVYDLKAYATSYEGSTLEIMFIPDLKFYRMIRDNEVILNGNNKLFAKRFNFLIERLRKRGGFYREVDLEVQVKGDDFNKADELFIMMEKEVYNPYNI